MKCEMENTMANMDNVNKADGINPIIYLYNDIFNSIFVIIIEIKKVIIAESTMRYSTVVIPKYIPATIDNTYNALLIISTFKTRSDLPLDKIVC